MIAKKIFISYSHRDEELMQQVYKHLKVYEFDDSLSIWRDEDIRIGEDFEQKIKEAIDKTDIAILLISTDFLVSDFIRERELAWLEKRYEMNRLEIIPFILKPSNWKTYRLSDKLKAQPKDGKSLIEFKIENGKREKVLSKFAKEINELYIDLDKRDKSIDDMDDTDDLFRKAFVIYKILSLYDKSKNYSFKLDENLYIYEGQGEYPIEIWKFVYRIENIDNYVSQIKGLFEKRHINTQIGIVQQNSLSFDLTELSSFLDIVRKLKLIADENTTKNMLSSFAPNYILTLKNIFEGEIKTAIELDFNTSSYGTGSTLLFSNFHILGVSSNELRQNIFKLIEEKYFKKLTSDGTNIYALELFINTFATALAYINIEKHKKINFKDIISRIDLLKIDLPSTLDLSFINKNQDLVEKNIAKSIDINIQKLYVESKAKLFYAQKESKSQDIETLNQFIKRDIRSLDFLILLGDFGHGKTTFFKYMTAELSKEYNDGEYIPIYISLREHYKKNGNLRDAVSNALLLKEKITDKFWDEHKWLIFCDGFDELNLFYQDEPNWVTSVFTELLNESKKENIKIVLSSRPVLFLDPNLKKDTVNNFDRVLLKPFDRDQIKEWLENWSKHNKLITIEMLEERNLLEVSQTPVILFLIATIFHEELNEKGIKYTKSQIYKKFFDSTDSSKKAKGITLDDKDKEYDVPTNYREILQNIACEIFTHPDEKSGMLHYDVVLKQLSQTFEEKDIKDLLSEKIFVAHAFKESIPEHVEFIHQSLREYLVAEKIFEVFYDLKNQSEVEYKLKYEDILFNIPISLNKVRFFRDMVKSMPIEDKNILAQRSQYIFDHPTILYQLIRDIPDRLISYSIFKKENQKIIEEKAYSDNQVVISNLMLFGFLFHLYTTNEVSDEFEFENLKKLTHFFNSHSQLENFNYLLKKSFTELSFKGIQIENIAFDEFEFIDNRFEEVTFISCSFDSTKFINVEFINSVKFIDCSFTANTLDNINFDGVEFENCDFSYFDSSKSKMLYQISTSYVESSFHNVTLNFESYKDTKFFDCIFTSSRFLDEDQKYDSKLIFNNCVIKDENDQWSNMGNDVWIEK